MAEEWESIEHALQYLSRADQIPHRTEGEAVLLEEIPPQAARILDIGAGDGRLLDLCLLKCRDACGVALDSSPPMLEKLRDKYGKERRAEVIEHDTNHPLPSSLGSFDVVVGTKDALARVLLSGGLISVFFRLVPDNLSLDHVYDILCYIGGVVCYTLNVTRGR